MKSSFLYLKTISLIKSSALALFVLLVMARPGVADVLATFAGGCFWCMEPPFEELPGVTAVISGFSGGTKDNPTYEEVSKGTSGHLEVVQVHFNPKKVSYEKLLEAFWRNVDPTDAGGQFVDRGPQYRTAIFFHSEEQKKQALASKALLQKSGRFKKTLVTEILPFRKFFAADDYHQDFYKNHKLKYKYYRTRSGRDSFLEATWPDNIAVK